LRIAASRSTIRPVLLGGLRRVALAAHVGQECAHAGARHGARVAPLQERFGAAGRLDRLDPEDRVAAGGKGPLALHGGVNQRRIDRCPRTLFA
jgi:hypothetical protein